MVRKVETTLVDDMTGEAADETVRFGLDGVEFEIDLSANNAVFCGTFSRTTRTRDARSASASTC